MVTENTETLYLLLCISYKQDLSMFCILMMSPQILKRSIDAKKVILQHPNSYFWLNLSHDRTLSNTITNYKKELCTLFIMIMGLASKNYARRTNPLPFKKFSYRDWDSFLSYLQTYYPSFPSYMLDADDIVLAYKLKYW